MSKKKSQSTDNVVCRNKKAKFRFELIEKIECGLVLKGAEVKSLREGRASLEEAYARFEEGELWLIGFHITQYSHDTSRKYDPVRKRKLLARGRELSQLADKVQLKRLTLVPVKVYFNERGIAKVQIALARGKTVSDKRDTVKERDAKREMRRYEG